MPNPHGRLRCVQPEAGEPHSVIKMRRSCRGWCDQASEPSWIAPFTGLRPWRFGKLVTVLRREGADAVRKTGRGACDNDCKAWEGSGAKSAVGKTTTIADGGYPGTGLVIPHRRERGQAELPAWQEERNKSHKQVRARVEHVFARMKTWKTLRDCRLKGDGVHHAMGHRACTTSPSPDRRAGRTAACPARGGPKIIYGTALGRTDFLAIRGDWPVAVAVEVNACPGVML